MVIDRESYDDYWKNVSVLNRAPTLTVPMFHVSGWFDIFSQGTLDFFTALQNEGQAEARGNQKMIIGPWIHSSQTVTRQGELTYPDNSVLQTDQLLEVINWFDYWLKGTDNGILDSPPMRYYLMGACEEENAPGNEWREVSNWPMPAVPSTLYLSSGGVLTGSAPDINQSSDTYLYDPNDPVPTVGGPNMEIPGGPFDQRALVESRPDVLVYTSEVLSEPLEITGKVTARLFASSAARDTDWVVRLCDVYPDGRSMLVTDGLRRAKFRNSFEQPELLQPGEIYEFEVDLWSTAIVFNAGHRIRISITSSNDPRFDPNPNTGDPLRKNTTTIIPANTIFHEGNRPSRIILPVISPENHPLFRSPTQSKLHLRVY